MQSGYNMSDITESQRRQLILEQRRSQRIAAEREANSRKEEAFTCDTCNKTFKSENAYNSHVESKKHRMLVAAARLVARAEAEEAAAAAPAAPAAPAAVVAGVTEEELESADVALATEAVGWDAIDELRAAAYLAGHELTPDEELAAIYEHVVSHRYGLAHTACPYCSFDASVAMAADDALCAPALPAHMNLTAPEWPRTPEEAAAFNEAATPAKPLAMWFKVLWQHIITEHKVHIPCDHCLVDAPGLVAFLQEKAGRWYTCIGCHKMHASLNAVRSHMTASGHVHPSVNGQSQADLAPFFDFTRDFTPETRRQARIAYAEAFQQATAFGLDENDALDAADDAMWECLQELKRANAPLIDAGSGALVLASGAIVLTKEAMHAINAAKVASRMTVTRASRNSEYSKGRELARAIAMPFTVDTAVLHRELVRRAQEKERQNIHNGIQAAKVPRKGFKSDHIYLI